MSVVIVKSQVWWDRRRHLYPFQCRTTTVLDGIQVPGHYTFISAILSDGVRSWGFTTRADLQAFQQYAREHLIEEQL